MSIVYIFSLLKRYYSTELYIVIGLPTDVFSVVLWLVEIVLFGILNLIFGSWTDSGRKKFVNKFPGNSEPYVCSKFHTTYNSLTKNDLPSIK